MLMPLCKCGCGKRVRSFNTRTGRPVEYIGQHGTWSLRALARQVEPFAKRRGLDVRRYVEWRLRMVEDAKKSTVAHVAELHGMPASTASAAIRRARKWVARFGPTLPEQIARVA